VKILVPVKRVVDYNVVVRPTDDSKSVDIENVKMGINPFDEIALEEAIKFKESGKATEVLVVSCGLEKCQDILRTSLAMGADRAILIKCKEDLFPITVAKILKKIFALEKPDLVLMGKQAIDDDCNQTGQMLAALLDLPQATFASKIEFPTEGKVIVSKEIDGGIEVVKLPYPAVITVDLRLNEPRYITLPNIMRAKKKNIETIDLEQLDTRSTSNFKILEVKEPKARDKGQIVNSVDELIQYIKNKSEAI